jgi:hypothetical protein
MQNHRVNRIDSRTIKRDQLGWLGIFIVDNVLHALHLDEWCFQKWKSFCWKSWEKLVFCCGADSSCPWGRWSVGYWVLLNIHGFWNEVFRKKHVGADSSRGLRGRSETNLDSNKKVCDSGGPGGRSVVSWRTVSLGQQASVTVANFTFYRWNLNSDSSWCGHDSSRGTHFDHNG